MASCDIQRRDGPNLLSSLLGAFLPPLKTNQLDLQAKSVRE